MKPGILAGIIVALVLGVGAFAFIATGEDDKPESNSNTTQTTQPSTDSVNNTTDKEVETEQNESLEDTSEATLGITMAEVGTHASADDCWTVINGSVYDITEYLPRHPGGEDIELACGVDGTSLFTNRTTDDGETIGSGEPHSSKAQSQLAQFKVGDLN